MQPPCRTRWLARSVGHVGPWVAALAMLACGPALVDQEFEGDAVYAHSRLMVREITPGVAAAAHRPRFAMFWNPQGIDGTPEELREQPRTSRPLPTELNSWTLFEPPEAALWATSAGGGRYAVGRLLAYDDWNEDGLRNPHEPWLGDSLVGLLYVPDALSAATSPFGRPVPAGAHRVEFPVACGPGPAPHGDCNDEIALGKQCLASEDCGRLGVCMLGRGRIWAHGVCGMVYDPQHACVPAAAALLWATDTEAAYFLQACKTNADCRYNMNEYCDHGIGGCLTGAELALWLGGSGPAALCRGTELP